MKSTLLAEQSELAPQHVVVICGGLLQHRNIFNDSVSRAAGLAPVRCAENREELLGVCRLLKVALIVARQEFIERLPGADVVSLTNYGTGSNLLAIMQTETLERVSSLKMLRLGCRGVLPCGFSPKLLRRAALAILKRELWAPGVVISELLSDLLRIASVKAESGLTPQETRILELTMEGHKNSAIAEALFISLETVRWHKRRLNRKLREPGRLPQSKAVQPPPREMAAG